MVKSQSRSYASRWNPLEASLPNVPAKHSLKLQDWIHCRRIESLWRLYRLFSSTTFPPQISRMPSSHSKTFNLRSSPVNKPQNLHSNKFGGCTILLNLGLFRDDPPSRRFLPSPPRSLRPPPGHKRPPVFGGRSPTGSRGRMLPQRLTLGFPTLQPKLGVGLERAQAPQGALPRLKINQLR